MVDNEKNSAADQFPQRCFYCRISEISQHFVDAADIRKHLFAVPSRLFRRRRQPS